MKERTTTKTTIRTKWTVRRKVTVVACPAVVLLGVVVAALLGVDPSAVVLIG